MISMYLDELTMSEFKEKVKENTVVILPIGAVEEHGAHLPLCTDSIQPEFVAERIAEKTDALIAPPIRYGFCSSTRNFPGTITISFDTLRSLIYDILSDLIRNGIKNIVVLSGHAGRIHMAALRLAAQRAVNESKANIMVLSDYDIAYDLLEKDESIPSDDGHSGLIETSRIMAIRGDLVKGKGEAGNKRPPKFMVLRDPETHFPSGVMGDPTNASMEKGQKINDFIISELVKLIEDIKKS
ncbi:MAG: creatininase family protein [Thermoplasmata archaeon]|nr:MAG: creatininase family protein [Thermoplasmata archaeon]